MRGTSSPPPLATLYAPAAVLTKDRILERYRKHIGWINAPSASPEAERADGSAQAPCDILEFRALQGIGHGYATLGASNGPLQHELVIVTIEHFAPYDAALVAIARAAPALAPGVVLSHAIPDTPFTALLCLPLADIEGSFALGPAGAPPFALRLAPLTAAEQALAERDVGRVVDLLRSAYAYTADRYRPCLVDVPPSPPASRTEIAMQRRQARAAILALRAEVLREHGPQKREMPVDTMPERETKGRIHLGSYDSLIYWVEQTIRHALRPYLRHPPPTILVFAEFIYVTIVTHPDAVRMVEGAVDPRNLPRQTGDGPDAATRRVTETLAITVARCHRQDSEAPLLALGLPAVREALTTFDPADEIPLENHVWAAVVPTLYEGLEDMKRPALRGMHRVIRRVAQSEAMLEYEPDPRPPLMRLGEIVARLAIELVTAYAAERRGQLPG